MTVSVHVYSKGLGILCLMPLSTIYQLYFAISFIDGGKSSTHKKPPTCGKSLKNIVT